ncbi:AAA family ATPase [Pacificibacter marinus]|uniref:DNA repair protein RadA n=1 Tax=Pacificibacter marinus TaxID=658057 RepID=A0A1Y5TN98_9RHOB|nr:AAA family ATPase [Pacificibacter marinus]SEK55323.1 Primase C terminal 2 (PriCT-2) [Pacificibacter marinus]SLN67954.1 DNA repair protein RadA [Pacificibacter marinus]
MPSKNTVLTDNLQAALSHAKAGRPVFPCKPDKSPLVKWRERATTDEDQIKTWWRKWPDAMAGLPMGQATGLAVLDLDKRPDKDGAAALRDLGFDLDSMSPCIIDTPSGGQHIYFQWHEGLGNSAAGLPAGVDVRGEGGYVIASGSKNATGAYSGDLTPDLPQWPEALRPARSDAPEATSGECDGLPMHHVKEALMTLPNDGDAYSNRDDWLKIGAALHHETEGSNEGLDLFQEWSGQHPTYDEGETESVWQSFRRSDGPVRTFATIRAEAESHGWIDLSSLDDCLTADELAAIDALIGMPESPQSRLRFLSPSDCESMPARHYVVKGLLAEGDVGCIVGAPGAGKSLVAPFIGYAVAQGERVFGHRTRAGGVLYVAAEDSHGMRGRVKALKDAHGDANAFFLVDGVSDLLNSRVAGKPSPDLGDLQKAVQDRKPALVVVDTIAMAFPALEENDAKSMGQVVAAARSLTKWGAAVLLIHHDTKEGSGIARGHSILNGALDMSLHIKRDGGVVVGNLTKNRNGTTDQPLAFTVKTVTLGEDEDGDPITTAMCQEADAPENKAKRLTPSVAAALAVFNDLPKPVSDDAWRQAVIDSRTVSASEDADSRRKAYKRAVEDLTRKGLIVFADGHFTLAAGDCEDFTDDMVGAAQ